MKEELNKWKVKAKVTPMINGALGTMTPQLENWLQWIPGTSSKTSVQKS